MGEEFLTVLVPSDRALEQAIVALKKGAHLLKYGRRRKPKFCPFRLSTDEKFLIWLSGEDEKQLKLSSVTNIVRGQRTKQLQPENECQSLSLIYGNGERSLDLICKDKAQADSWFLGLRAVTSRCCPPRSIGTSENRRGAQSCVNSPAGFMRRKHNLGLSVETTKFSQVQSLCGSPTQSFSERGFSDALSCSSNSFYSASSLSNMQNPVDIVAPNSPYIETDDLKKRTTTCAVTKIHPNMLNRNVTPVQESSQIDKNVLRDVLIWGEGIEGGCLGGGVDKSGYHNGIRLDALLPKLLESTTMLDVETLSLGGKHAALVTKQGEVFCWGEGKGGRLGHKVDMDITCPKVVDSLSGVHIKSVACGEYQTCALTHSGELYTWGDDCYGADLTGFNRKRSRWLPSRFSGLLDGLSISSVSCGDWHTAIVSRSGQLFTFGDGTFGVLGHGNLESISQPKEVESLQGLRVKSVACGPWHTAAIVDIIVDRFKSNDPGGKLFTWGDGDKGRLGHASKEKKLLPTCVAQLVDHDFVRVSCGRMLTVGLTNTGTVYTMGSAVHGQLGNPVATDKSITIVQGKLKHEFVREISSGSYHIAALTSRGNVYMWGKGVNGQLGLGDIEDRSSPTLVEALRERQVESITCGSSSTAAICLHKSISCTDQSACRGCSMAFGFTRKKHNCYNCGLLFCHACSSKKATSACLAPNKRKPFRVCDPCFNHLQRNAQSGRLLKLENNSPRPLSTSQKKSFDEKDERREAATTGSQMMSPRNCCDEDDLCRERKITKKQGEDKQHSETISSLSGRLPRWGQVSSPVCFRNCHREQIMTSNFALKDQLSCAPPISSQNIPLGAKSTNSAAVNVERHSSEAEKILAIEVQKLRAQAESLEKLCQSRGEKIQECQQRTEETWLFAKEEAAKSKAAKEVIQALTSRLHLMSEKLSARREAKDQVGANAPQLKSISTDRSTAKNVHPMFVGPQEAPEVGRLEGRKVDSLCTSPILFSNRLRNIHNRDISSSGHNRSEEESCVRTENGENGIDAKVEWVEQYQPGVYITFTTLPSGKTGLKRVRFSRKKFSEKEAESWWEENQVGVYHKYGIEGYTSSIHNAKKC